MPLSELETSTYQDHVIKHVTGATVLGWFDAGDAVHFLLDVGLLWTVYVSGEMQLMAQNVAIGDLESDDCSAAQVRELQAEAQRLISEGRTAAGLKHFAAASVDYLITDVKLFGNALERKIVVTGEAANLELSASVDSSAFKIEQGASV